MANYITFSADWFVSGFTVYFDIDVWKGLLATLVITIPYYAVQRLMPLSEMMDQMIDGFKSMLPAIST